MAKNFNSDNPWAEMARVNTGKNPVASQAVGDEELSDDSVEYTLDELQEMSLKELQAIAKEAGVDFKGLSKDELIDALAEETDLITDDSEDEVLLADSDTESDADSEDLATEEIDGEMTLEQALALLGEDSETEDDFSDQEIEEVEEEVLEGEVEAGISNN